MIGYVGNIEEITGKNNHFRQVIYTGAHAQLVVMTIAQGEEIGVEIHENVDQFFRIETGTAKFVINGKEFTVSAGMVAIVPAGAMHNVVNIGSDDLRLYTLYSPPNHPSGTIHHTKADAQNAENIEHRSRL